MGLLGQVCGDGGVDGCASAGATAGTGERADDRSRSQQPMHARLPQLHNL
jgi:hypothetical protein